MRKLFLLVLFAIVVIPITAQEKLIFQKVIQVDSVIAEDIFVSIKEWLSMNFKSGNNAVELEDKAAGVIILNATSPYKCTKRGLSYMWADGSIDYKINVQIRNNRYRISITNFMLKCPNNGGESMGILTTAEESNYTRLGKKQYNEVWKDLKIKAEIISNGWFDKFGTIRFKDFKNNSSEDW